MSDFKPGLEGVVAFETEIAEPDKEGSALRYRGVDIEDLIGRVSFANVWALLVDGAFGPGLPPAEPFPVPVHSGDIRVDVQSAVAMLSPYYGLKQLLDISDQQARDDLARVSVTALSFVAQSARGLGLPAVPQREIDKARTITERFMIRWRGEPDPRHVQAVDAYFISAAEHGMNASTFTARICASTGADAAACISAGIGALSGPLHGGAPSRVLHMIEAVERTGNAEAYGLDVETAWIKLAGLQGMQKLRRIMPLGEYRGAHRLQIRIAYDYSDSDADGPTWVDDKAWEPTPTTVGGPLQVRHGCKQKRCQAAKVRRTARDSALAQAPTTEALKPTGLAFEVGIKPGLYQRLPAAQKQ